MCVRDEVPAPGGWSLCCGSSAWPNPGQGCGRNERGRCPGKGTACTGWPWGSWCYEDVSSPAWSPEPFLQVLTAQIYWRPGHKSLAGLGWSIRSHRDLSHGWETASRTRYRIPAEKAKPSQPRKLRCNISFPEHRYSLHFFWALPVEKLSLFVATLSYWPCRYLFIVIPFTIFFSKFPLWVWTMNFWYSFWVSCVSLKELCPKTLQQRYWISSSLLPLQTIARYILKAVPSSCTVPTTSLKKNLVLCTSSLLHTCTYLVLNSFFSPDFVQTQCCAASIKRQFSTQRIKSSC